MHKKSTETTASETPETPNIPETPDAHAVPDAHVEYVAPAEPEEPAEQAPQTEQEKQEQPEELPAWLHPDDDEMPPAALQAIYAHIEDLAITKICETARKSMRNAYVSGLVAVRDALAKSGLFKEWCEAAGINYATAKSILHRAAHPTLPQDEPNAQDEQRPAGFALQTRSAAVRSDDVRDGNIQDDRAITKVVLHFANATFSRVEATWRRVMDSQGFQAREDAIAYICAAFDGRGEAEPEAESEPEAEEVTI